MNLFEIRLNSPRSILCVIVKNARLFILEQDENAIYNNIWKNIFKLFREAFQIHYLNIDCINSILRDTQVLRVIRIRYYWIFIFHTHKNYLQNRRFFVTQILIFDNISIYYAILKHSNCCRQKKSDMLGSIFPYLFSKFLPNALH